MSKEKNYDRYDPVYEWWIGLMKNRGERARLARLEYPLNAAFHPGCHQLAQTLETIGFAQKKDWERNRTCVLAALLAHVKEDSGLIAPCALAAKKGDSPLFSALRFRRLVSHEDVVSLYPSMLRAIKLLKRQIHIRHLAESLLFWNGYTRREWAFQYYGDNTQKQD